MKITYTIVVIAIITLVGFAIGWNSKPVDKNVGSVQTASEYQSTNTYLATSSSQVTQVIKTEPGTLGSVITSITGTAPLTIYNATTTNVNLRALATSSLPVLAYFGASPTVGTYTFDEIFTDGLVAVFGTGTISSTTITWR